MTRRNAVDFYQQRGWRVTSPYGRRTGRFAGFHRGIDFGGRPCNFPIETPFDGIVTAARTSGMGTWGNTVCILLDNTNDRIGTLHAHLQRIDVAVNQIVKAGDQIGTNGGTNHRGPDYACHIHLEVLWQNSNAPWRGDLWGDPAQFYLDQLGINNRSKKFNNGDMIYNTIKWNVRVRQLPGTSSRILRVIRPGQEVRIANHNNNGVQANGYYWWNIVQGGWVAEDFFEKL